ncbi:MAG TPA: cytochrome P450 [Acidimicrobiia bacterium]|nr:cytochrome P450 [Acidimicrobiia bacterium]
MSGQSAVQWDRMVDGMMHAGDAPGEQTTYEDPYPRWAEMRAVAPVHARGSGASPETLGHDVIVLGFDEAQLVLRDSERFATTVYGLLDPVMGRTILEMDGAEHKTNRAFVMQAFTKAAIARWETDVIAPIVDAAVDKIVRGNGRADLVAELTFPVPFAVIAGMLGLPSDELEALHDFAIDLIGAGIDERRAVHASERLRITLAEVIKDRRRTPQHDIVSTLAHARGPGRRLTDDEILSFLLLLLPAGGETSFRSTSTLLWTLLDDPARLAAVRADRSLLPAAVEEGLRWEPPVVSMTRVARGDTELAGVPIAAGATIAACVGAANRDARYWENAEQFDLHREPRPFLTFGSGPHLCLGLHLVRTETVSMITRVFDRLPGLRRDPDRPWPQVDGVLLRSPSALPVVFDR